MKTIQAIYVICCLSLIFAIFSTIIKRIKLSKVRRLKENTCKISMAKKPPTRTEWETPDIVCKPEHSYHDCTLLFQFGLLWECNKVKRVLDPMQTPNYWVTLLSEDFSFCNSKFEMIFVFLSHIIIGRRWCTLQYFRIQKKILT